MLAYVKAVVNSNFIPVCSPHPQCLFFPLPLSELLLFPIDCAFLLLFTLIANILAPVLLLPCWLPMRLQLPFAPLHHRNSLIQLLMTFPMLQPSCFFSGIVSLHGHIQLFPRVHQLLSSKSVFHGSDHDDNVLSLAFLHSARWYCCRCPQGLGSVFSSLQGRGTGSAVCDSGWQQSIMPFFA